jgi:DNA mismatch repair protein MutS
MRGGTNREIRVRLFLVVVASLSLSFRMAVALQVGPPCAAFKALSKEQALEQFAKGAKLHRLGPEYYSFAERTIKDLELDKLAEKIGEFALTSIGKEQLKWMLYNPSLDPEDIRERQQAVLELKSNPKMRKAVENVLGQIKAFEASDYFWHQKLLRKLFRWDFKPNPLTENFAKFGESENPWRTTKRNLGLFLSPLLAAVDPAVEWYRGMPITGRLFAFLGGVNPIRMGEMRETLYPFKLIANASSKLSKSLGSAHSKYLRDSADWMGSVNQRGHELGVKKTAAPLRRMLRFPLTLLVDLPFISNFTLSPVFYRTRRELPKLASLASAVAELDAYLAFAKMSESKTGFVLPEILDSDNPTQLKIDGGHQPLLYLNTDKSVPNDLYFDAGDPSLSRVKLVMGFNAGGKSTYGRMPGQGSALAQAGSFVSAKRWVGTANRIVASFTNPDDTVEGVSRFQSEVRRMAGIYRDIQEVRHVIYVLDEIFSGTGYKGQMAAIRAVLEDLIAKYRMGIVTTHLTDLKVLEAVLQGLETFHVSQNADTQYKVERGPATGVNFDIIMEEKGLPPNVVARARQIFRELEAASSN